MKFERIVESYTYNHFGEFLYILHTNNRKYLNDSMAKHGLNLVQSMCLLTLYKKEDTTQKDLTDLLYLTKSGITKAINKLQEDGFVVKEKSDKDQRKYVLKLTEKGREIIPILISINKEWENKIGFSDLNDDFLKTLKSITYKSMELNLENE